MRSRLLGQGLTTFSALFYLGVLAPVAARADVKVQHEGQGRTWTVNIDGIDFTPADYEGTAFVKASMRGIHGYEGVTYEESKPQLPVVRLWVSGDGDLKVEAANEQSHVAVPGATGYLRPAIPSSVKRMIPIIPFVINWNTYLAAITTTKPAYEIQDVGTVRGVKRRLVTLFPFRYDPSGKSGSIVLQFKITQSKVPAREERLAHDERFALVVPAKFAKSPSLKLFKQWKESLGYTVDVVEISPDDAKPEKIRNELKDIYTYNSQTLRWAILVGTNADLPGYQSDTINGVTDHYYRCLDTDDYAQDVATPDIGVGRFSAQNEEQLKAMVDKTITYEKGQFANEDWLRRFSFLASDDPNYWTVAEGTHDYVIDRYTSPRGYTGSYPGANEAGGDKIYAITYKGNTPEVKTELALGRGLINYGGHGGSDEWVSPHFTVNDVKELKMNGAIPWVIANACDTADYRNGESIAEAWERNPNGAIAYLGSMDSTYWDEDDIYERRMYDGIFEKGVSRLGDINEFAKNEVYRYYGGKGRSRYYEETYVTMGDPSVALRTWSSRGLKIWGPAQVRTGTKNANFQVVDDNNVPVAGARVALNSDSYDYHSVAFSDRSGNVTLPLGRGTRFTVTASGQNLRFASHGLRVKENNDVRRN